MYNTYDHYTTYPSYQTYPSCQGYTDYGNYPTTLGTNYTSFEDDDDDRFIGPIAPFLLGGLAGAAVAPYFYRPYPYFYPYRPFF
jgi:hypothetical protein